MTTAIVLLAAWSSGLVVLAVEATVSYLLHDSKLVCTLLALLVLKAGVLVGSIATVSGKGVDSVRYAADCWC